MDNKKVIAFSLCGSILLGATACADQQTPTDTTQTNVTAQTELQNQDTADQTGTLDTAETPDTTPTTEKLSASAKKAEEDAAAAEKARIYRKGLYHPSYCRTAGDHAAEDEKKSFGLYGRARYVTVNERLAHYLRPPLTRVSEAQSR